MTHTSPACPYCGSPAVVLLHTTDINRGTTDETFTYHRCTRCRLIFLHPIPDDLGRYYQSDYYAVPESLDALAAYARSRRHKLDLLRRYISAGSVLELGPSFGDFAYQAKQAGYVVEAVEMDAECVQFLREQVGIRVTHSSDMLGALKKLGSYDAIAMWQVIEHVERPWDVIAEMTQHVKPGGVIIIATPNPDAALFRLFGARWAHLDAPRHLNLLPPTLLREQVARHGLVHVHTSTRDRDALQNEDFAWKKSLMNRLGIRVAQGTAAATPDHVPKRSLKYRLSRAGLRVLSGGLTILGYPMISASEHGSTYTAIFRAPR